MFNAARFLADFAPHRTWESIFRVLVPASAVAVVCLPGAGKALPFEDVLETLSIGLVIIGIALRIATFGFERGKTVLLTQGAHSALRYPVLLSDALIGSGIIIGTQAFWFIAPGMVLLFALFWLAVSIRDEETARAVGAIAASWRAGTPALIPDLSQWKADGLSFSARAALARSMPALFVSTGFLTALEIAHDVLTGSASWNFWPADWDYYLAALFASFVLVVIDAGARSMQADRAG
jgi:hypothetical protein